MPVTHVGDLSRNYMFRAESARLKTQLTRLTQELSSGITTDKTEHLKGNQSLISAIDHALSMSSAYEIAAQEAKSLADAKQTAFSYMQNNFSQFSSSLLAAAQSQQPVAFDTLALQANQNFSNVIAKLNTTVAGRSVFAGNATESAAMAQPDVILADLQAAVAGSVTTADFLNAIDNWFFTPGGGFETTGYIGATDDLDPLPIAKDQSVSLSQRADEDGIRQMLRDLAVMALSTDTTLGFNALELKNITTETAESTFQTQSNVTTMRATLGLTQGQIDHGITALNADKTAQTLARNALVAVDPFETATELENIQFQMEALYSITARLSRLSLTEYLR
ncbi:flagellin [Cognatishimia sp. 1_MG-2023]|uniref:flagellin n=1 Tax=Cognatishimia sp. 1_MG-2023 TaxID=3062642 RepID=UPI0026E39885|nr:flagellin [Cognatishimia sp. 1_MG-2023]MDO6726919.1 flagellin [Cognatishimia sp. 1_MG-2023]